MRVRISGSECNRGEVRLRCFLHPAGLIENIAKIEVAQRVAVVNFNGFAVVKLGCLEILPVIKERSQVDVSSGVRRIKLEHPLIALDCFYLRCRIFLKADRLYKDFSHGFRRLHRPYFG